MKRFKIFVGRDHYNRRPVYQVMDKVGDYVGEFHKSRKEAQAELKDLMRSIRKNPMKRKTRKKRIVRRKRRVVRRNPGVKQGYALIRGGGPTGMKMVVVSTHKTREGAETAMIKKGGTPQSLFTKGYSIFAFGPGTRYEYLDTEFTGKFLRPIVGNRRRRLRGNPARTNKAHFGYAKMGMELLGTGLKIKKGERVYMTPATNIPGGGFFVEPAYRTGLWKQGSADDAILIAPKDFDDEITYVEPRGEYRPTPQVKPDYKYGIYTGRGIARNPMLGKYEQKALNFARKYPGWHGFDPRKPTANIVRKLAKKGLVKVSNISNQFRAI